MRGSSQYCSLSCNAKAQPRDYQKGDNNPAKRPEVREKIRLSKLGDKNPMKREEVSQKVANTNKIMGNFIKLGDIVKRLNDEGKIPHYPMSVENRYKQSERMKINNPMYDKAIMTKAKDTLKYNYTNGITPRPKRTNEQKEKYRLTKLGDKNPFWRGGYTRDYTEDFNEENKEKVRERDGYSCQLCGKSQFEELLDLKRKLVCHHIDYNKKNGGMTNLIAVCLRCHNKVNHNREYWTEYFANLLNSNNGGNKGLCGLNGQKLVV
jgi:hypothetical protein